MLRGKDEGAAENSKKNPSKVKSKYLPKPKDGMSESSVGVYSIAQNTNPTSVLDIFGFYFLILKQSQLM